MREHLPLFATIYADDQHEEKKPRRWKFPAFLIMLIFIMEMQQRISPNYRTDYLVQFSLESLHFVLPATSNRSLYI